MCPFTRQRSIPSADNARKKLRFSSTGVMLAPMRRGFKSLVAPPILWGLVVSIALATPLEAQTVRTVEGTLTGLVAELTSSAYCLYGPDTDPRPYLDPSDHVATFFNAARLIDHGAIEEASQLAQEVDYELCRFFDSESEQHYWLLREDLKRVLEPRGWGAYLLNPQSDLPAIVGAPHPIDDYDSAKVAALVFAQGAKGLLIAGTHRAKADVPDLINSVFHQVHVAWTGTLGEVTAWQIHGYAKAKHSFPRNARAILSTGGGEVIDAIVRLENELGLRGVEGYVYNSLEPKDELNLLVNDGIAGSEFRALAATKNEQGRHVRKLGGNFVHVELDRELRAKKELRLAVSEAIAASMREVLEVADVLQKSTPQESLVEELPLEESKVRTARND
jgi:hypothetical protein